MSLDFSDDVFNDLTGSLGDVFPEILAVFFEETEIAINDFETKISEQQWQDVKDISHKMKSSCQMFGATGLAHHLEEIEEGELQDASDLFVMHKTIKKEYENVKKYILSKVI